MILCSAKRISFLCLVLGQLCVQDISSILTGSSFLVALWNFLNNVHSVSLWNFLALFTAVAFCLSFLCIL